MKTDELTVYVEAFPEKDTYGETNIVLPKGQELRSEFLNACSDFWKKNNMPEEADKFYQAAKQDLNDD